MNMIEGRVTGGMVQAAGARLPLPAGARVAEGQDLIYGIRPEHLSASATGIACNIAVVEPTGSETHVVLRAEGREFTAVFRDRVTFRPGDALTLAPDAAAVHLFDKATGARL